MTWYEDGSPYVHLPGTVPTGTRAVNIGWLAPDRPFPHKDAGGEFSRSLLRLCCTNGQQRTRGWHGCPLSHAGEDVGHPIRVSYAGCQVALGSAELRLVAADGRWLVAPDLVYHYVAAHSYLPPGEFIEAAVSGRVAPSDALRPGVPVTSPRRARPRTGW